MTADGNRPGRKPGARRAFLHYAWSVRVGTVIVCRTQPAPVVEITDYPPDPNRSPDVPIRPDYYARRWRTARGDRWVGWHPSELPETLPMEGLPR